MEPLACYQPVTRSSDIDNVNGIARIRLNRLTNVMDVPFGQFLSFASIGLISLRF